ncbi:MAG: pantetheine-phosphate adenylyltransferase [Planctomycetes bacterium]|nr:pantetheine-phosphate adenylyltransferase [Planctomycetota bacterium]
MAKEARSARIALYPGSFDPPTRGHLDLLARAAALFDRVVVGVVENPSKTPLLALEERVAILEREVKALGLPAVEVRAFQGLTVDFAESVGAGWIVRGVRSAVDLDDEVSMALTNRAVSKISVETVFLPARAELSFIRSRLVREIAARGGALAPLVTPEVEKALRRRLGKG